MPASTMHLQGAGASPVCTDRSIYESCLPLASARILDLGCGKAEHARAIANAHPDARVTAMEVDVEQHASNCASERPGNLEFVYGGAERIPATDGAFDIVMMFKSLHHVPAPHLDQALAEVARVLRPGGYAYVSEPIFAGPLNGIMRIFHDEEAVRAKAFDAIVRAVDGGSFRLLEERFFSVPTHFRDFADFERKVLQVTHTRHRLDDAQLAQVRERFESHMSPEGATFAAPQRLDLLARP